MKRQWLGWKYALVIIGLVILTLLVMDFNNRMAELRRLSDQKEIVAAKVTNLVNTQQSLETQIAFATSDAAVLEWAYQEGKWVREGDHPVVPLQPPGETPEPTVVAVVTPQPENNLEIWLSLFVDR
jgi:cell division protein FtsB